MSRTAQNAISYYYVFLFYLTIILFKFDNQYIMFNIVSKQQFWYARDVDAASSAA